MFYTHNPRKPLFRYNIKITAIMQRKSDGCLFEGKSVEHKNILLELPTNDRLMTHAAKYFDTDDAFVNSFRIESELLGGDEEMKRQILTQRQPGRSEVWLVRSLLLAVLAIFAMPIIL